MTSALLLNCSPHGSASRAYLIAQSAIANLRDIAPDLELTERDLWQQSLPALGPAYANAIIAQAPKSSPMLSQSEELIRELEACDYLLIATPMHNFTVPASLKLWIDNIARMGRTMISEAGHKIGLLRDRPVLVTVTSGGLHQGDNARQPDFLSPYVSHILATVGIKSVRFIYLQGTARPDIAAASQAMAVRQLAADPVFGRKVDAL